MDNLKEQLLHAYKFSNVDIFEQQSIYDNNTYIVINVTTCMDIVIQTTYGNQIVKLSDKEKFELVSKRIEDEYLKTIKK